MGNILKEKRLEKRLSMDALAKIANVSKTYIANTENGKRSEITGELYFPSQDIVERLAVALEWNVNEALMVFGYAPKNLSVRDLMAEEIIGYLDRMEPRDRERVRQIVRTFAVA